MASACIHAKEVEVFQIFLVLPGGRKALKPLPPVSHGYPCPRCSMDASAHGVPWIPLPVVFHGCPCPWCSMDAYSVEVTSPPRIILPVFVKPQALGCGVCMLYCISA